MSILRDKFGKGLTPAQFEDSLGENKELHDHHYKKNDVSSCKELLEGKLAETKIMIVTEPWCGDSLAVVPTLLKLLEDNDAVTIRFVPRDENLDLIDQYLTNGGRAIPKIIVTDSEFNELFNWGPRPVAAQQVFEDHRTEIAAGKIEKTEVHKKIRAFYARNRGKAICEEFSSLLLDNA